MGLRPIQSMVTEVMPEVKAICSNRDQLAIVRLISSFFFCSAFLTAALCV